MSPTVCTYSVVTYSISSSSHTSISILCTVVDAINFRNFSSRYTYCIVCYKKCIYLKKINVLEEVSWHLSLNTTSTRWIKSSVVDSDTNWDQKR